MPWRHDRWTVDHRLPIGVSEHAMVGQSITAGDVVASGSVLGLPVRVRAARRVGVAPEDLTRVMRVPAGAEVERGALLARTGRRFARGATAPIGGRVLALRADGDLEMAPVLGRWSVRTAVDGVVTRADDAVVRVEGEAWCLQGLAAYGPDAFGELTLACEGGGDDLAPGRIDTRLRRRILVGGGRAGPEAIARGHACGVAAVVAGAVPASGLRQIYGDEVTAHGSARVDVPTVLCLIGFGGTVLPEEVYAPLVELAGRRAAIHAATARLFVFAPADAAGARPVPSLALAPDWMGVRPVAGGTHLGAPQPFPSGIAVDAFDTDAGAVPSPNLREYELPSR